MPRPDTLTAAEYNARHKPKPKPRKTGPGSASSSPVAPPGAPAGAERHPHASSAARAKYGALWRTASVFLCTLHYTTRSGRRLSREVCLDPEQFFRVLGTPHRAESPRVAVHLDPDA